MKGTNVTSLARAMHETPTASSGHPSVLLALCAFHGGCLLAALQVRRVLWYQRQENSHTASPCPVHTRAALASPVLPGQTMHSLARQRVPPAPAPARCVWVHQTMHARPLRSGTSTSSFSIRQMWPLLRLHGAPAARSVVAFATGTFDRLPYAIKFFAEREPFMAELAVRDAGAVGALAPHIKAVNDPYLTDSSPGPSTDRFGRPLPPCIAIARGESLTEWSHRAQPDIFQAVSVRAHAAPVVCPRRLPAPLTLASRACSP